MTLHLDETLEQKYSPFCTNSTNHFVSVSDHLPTASLNSTPMKSLDRTISPAPPAEIRTQVRSKHFFSNSPVGKLSDNSEQYNNEGSGDALTGTVRPKNQTAEARTKALTYPRPQSTSKQVVSSQMTFTNTSRTQVLNRSSINKPSGNSPSRMTPGQSQGVSANHGSQFSASDSLSAFLKLRGKTVTAGSHCGGQIAQVPKDNSIKPVQPSACKDTIEDMETQRLNELHVPTNMYAKEAMSDLPTHQYLGKQRTVVINNRLMLNNPGLIQFCEREGSDLLSVLYRDFGISDGACPDMILSPTSCLLLTNIQSFTQRPLPGQRPSAPGSSFVHERVRNLAEKFDHVVLLVACPIVPTVDTTSITVLSAFCHTISCTTSSQVKVVYVAHKTSRELENAINAWVWASIIEYAFPVPGPGGSADQNKRLYFIQDETVWELFLRRVGLNVMAAQIIPAVLKSLEANKHCLETGSRDRSSTSSLSWFVQMDRRERSRLFDSIIGSRAVELINSVLGASDTD